MRIKCENMVIKLGATLNMKMPSYVEYSDNLVELFMLYHAIPCYAMIQHEKKHLRNSLLHGLQGILSCFTTMPMDVNSTPRL